MAVILLITLMITNINIEVFAIGYGQSDNVSEEYIQTDEGKYYYWKEHDWYDSRMFLFYVSEDMGTRLEENYGIKWDKNIELNQFAYYPINNNGDPYNLAPLFTEEAALKVFEIKENSDDPTRLAKQYETVMGGDYATTYPVGSPWVVDSKEGTKNYNYKKEGFDPINKIFKEDGLLFFIYQGVVGNFRYSLSAIGEKQHFPWHGTDKFSTKNLPFNFKWRDYKVWTIVTSYLTAGEYTFDYNEGYVSEGERIKVYMEYISVYPDIEHEMKRLSGNYNDPRVDYEAANDQSKKFYGLANQYTKPSKGVSGQATLVFQYTDSKGELRTSWASIFTPATSMMNNIRYYDMRIFDADTNTELTLEDIEDKHGNIKSVGIPSNIANIKLQYRYGYEDGARESLNVQGKNNNILTNVFLRDLAGADRQIEPLVQSDNVNKMSGFYKYNWERFFELAEQTNIMNIVTLSETNNDIIIIDESKLNTYEVVIPVIELDSEGYFLTNTPWQTENYANDYNNGTIQFYADNVNTEDDRGFIKYTLEEPPSRDLKITDVSGFGTWNDSLKKFEVESGQTYNVTVNVMNNGTAATTKANPEITWDTNTFSAIAADQVRDNDSNKTETINPQILSASTTDSLEYTLQVTIPSTLDDGDIFNLGIAIHEDEDTVDNVYVVDDDFKALNAVIDVPASSTTYTTADIGIADIILKSGGTSFTTKVDEPNFYGLDGAIRNYQVKIVLEKYSGTAPVVNPRINLYTKADSLDAGYNSGSLIFSGTLTNVGDTVSKTVSISTYNQYLDIIADIDNDYHLNTNPKANIENSNDSMHKIWTGDVDFQVSDVIVSPSKLYISSGSSTTSPATVTAEINTLSYSSGIYDNVIVELRMKSPSGSTITLETKYEDLGSGTEYIVFNVPSRNYYSGNYSFEVEVNRDRAYSERSYSNNIGSATLEVSAPPCATTLDYCWGGAPRTRNEWQVYHTIIEREKNWVTLRRCTSYSIYTTSSGRTRKRCTNYQNYEACRGSQSTFAADPSPKDYYETFNLIGQAQSSKTDWNWQNGNIEVNAGRAFKVRWQLRYYTNRYSYPRTQNLRDNGECGGDYTRPTYSSYYFSTPVYVQITGYSFPEEPSCGYSLMPTTTSGNWYNRTLIYEFPMHTDALGDVTSKFYTDLNTSDRSITFSAWTDKVHGYALANGERNGDIDYLVDCKALTVRVVDAIDINGKTVDD